MTETIVFVDLETTGFNPETDHIIEIGAVKAKDGEITDRFSTLVSPGVSLPAKIVALTGITDEMLDEAPDLADIAGAVREFIGDLPIAGHNISFDMSFLNRRLGFPLHNRTIDTIELAQMFYPCESSYRLESLRESLDIKSGKSHRALEDAEAACRLFFKTLDRLQNLNSEVMLKVYETVGSIDWATGAIIKNSISTFLSKFPAGKKSSPYSFLNICHQNDNTLFDREKNSNNDNKLALNNPEILLEPGGPLAATMPLYKHRTEQVRMLQAIRDSFAVGHHLVIEAGTGTGKSLAYLLPAIAWAVNNQTKVVVATHTINLQEQLWKQDLPNIKAASGIDFKAALIKGRTNYLCLRRWESKLKEAEFSTTAELVFLLKTVVWLAETTTGDRSEINISPVQQHLWNDLASDGDTCLGPVCSWFNKHCFIQRARRAADTADLLIVNHSLLLADIKVENRLLPAYDYLIIDEAHHLENSATEQLGWTISTAGLRNFLLSLIRGYGAGGRPGLLNQLKQAFQNNKEMFSQAEAESLDNLINVAFEHVRNVHDAAKELEEFLTGWAVAENGSGEEDRGTIFRIKEGHKETEQWQLFMAMRDNFRGRNMSLMKVFKKIAATLDPQDDEEKKAFLVSVKDLDFARRFLEETVFNLDDLAEGTEECVYWIEYENRVKTDARLKCAPVTVDQLLCEGLFSVKASTVLTSATISVDGDFTHFTRRTGLSLLPPETVQSFSFTSPFSYERQCMLCVVRDVPDPTTVEQEDFVQHITPVIRDVIRIFKGKTMVLFTSHKMLSQVYTQISPALQHDGLSVLGHRIDGGRSRLIEEFRKNPGSALFGTSSFWEGVDLPGDILKCVIVVRLPFSPPNTPVVEARIEELTKNNRDSFYSYMVPEAVIRLKQGFGRLIRSESDEGVVVVLDSRIVDRHYGRKFLNSLPVKTHFRGDTSSVLQKISDWAAGERPDESCLKVLGSTDDIEKYLRNLKKRKRD